MLPLIDSFQLVAQTYNDQIAIKDQNHTVRYGQLAGQIDRLACWLLSYKLIKGDRVGIHLQNSIEYVILYYACWRARLVPVAVNTFASNNEIEFWLKDSACKLLFSKHYKSPSVNIPVLEILYTQGQLTIENQAICEDPANTVLKSPDPDDLASIIYTSGTTGNPKGITLLHRNLSANIASVSQSLEISSKDTFLCVLPFFYSFGNSILHTHLGSGGTLVLLNRIMYPIEILKTIERERCNGFAGVPSIYISLLKKTSLKQYDLSSLRYMTQAGGPLSKEFIRQMHTQLPKVKFVIMYGQTEATARISYLPADFLETKMGSVGIGIKGVEIMIMDKNGRECSAEQTGEICVKGENIMQGYWNNPEATAHVLINERLHTGDMGYKDKDGFLYIVGRQSELLKISEHRVSPYEIEEVLLSHEAVEECAVIGCSHEQMGQFARAFIVKNGKDISTTQLKKFCKYSLASYKIPKQIVFVKSLPRTSSGKIMRNQLSC